jgi:hypothetical protein
MINSEKITIPYSKQEEQFMPAIAPPNMKTYSFRINHTAFGALPGGQDAGLSTPVVP